MKCVWHDHSRHFAFPLLLQGGLLEGSIQRVRLLFFRVFSNSVMLLRW